MRISAWFGPNKQLLAQQSEKGCLVFAPWLSKRELKIAKSQMTGWFLVLQGRRLRFEPLGRRLPRLFLIFEAQKFGKRYGLLDRECHLHSFFPLYSGLQRIERRLLTRRTTEPHGGRVRCALGPLLDATISKGGNEGLLFCTLETGYHGYDGQQQAP